MKSILFSFIVIMSAYSLEVQSPTRKLRLDVSEQGHVFAILCSYGDCLEEEVSLGILKQRLQEALKGLKSLINDEQKKEALRAEMKSQVSLYGRAVSYIANFEMTANSHLLVDMLVDDYLSRAVRLLEGVYDDPDQYYARFVEELKSYEGKINPMQSEEDFTKLLGQLVEKFQFRFERRP